MLKRWHWIALGVVGLAVAGFALSFAFTAEHQVCAPNDYTHAKECAQHHLGPFIVLWIITAMDAHNGFITALATTVMAIFTGTLWFVTNKSVQLARAEFITSHRPRIKIRFISHPIEQRDGTALFKITVVNVGDTPANIIGNKFEAIEHDGTAGVGVSMAEPSVTEDVWLVSGNRHIFSYRTEYPWALLGGDNVLYVTGEIAYTDEAGSRGITRHTGFARKYDRRAGSYGPADIYAEEEYED